ncbi:hypothetical protein DZB91_08385 [Brevibacillus sp. VP]|nr:hypothetical protein DZB91_08385 [Brevibacillus sp. VP]
MRKFCIPLLSMALFTSVIEFTPNYTSAKEITSVDITEDNQYKIDKRLVEIADKYEIGEEIKGDDLEFIKQHAIKVEDNDGMKPWIKAIFTALVELYENIIYYNVFVDGSVKSSSSTLTVRGKEA